MGRLGREPGGPWKGGRPYVRNDTSMEGGVPVSWNMRGDDSRIIMDRVVPFIEEQAEEGQPFFAAVWFHTPHKPVIAGPEDRARYSHLDDKKQRHYYGAITAMDEQVGRLRALLRRLDVAENTLVIFTSDNGTAGDFKRAGIASTGPFRGNKHMIYDGGLRVPTVMEWPGHLESGASGEMARTDALASTTDVLPTVLDLPSIETPEALQGEDGRPMDGVSLRLPLLGSEEDRAGYERSKPVKAGWKRLYQNADEIAFIGERYKLLSPRLSDEYELYDLRADPDESNDLAEEMPGRVREMKQALQAWQCSARRSREGADYKY